MLFLQVGSHIFNRSCTFSQWWWRRQAMEKDLERARSHAEKELKRLHATEREERRALSARQRVEEAESRIKYGLVVGDVAQQK